MNRERDPMSKAQGTAESEQAQRTSVSGLVLPEEQVSASHTIQLAEVPSRQLDRLLVLANDLPTSDEDALFQAFVDALPAVIPGHSIAVVVGEGDATKSFRVEGVVNRPSPYVRPTLTRGRTDQALRESHRRACGAYARE